MLLDFVKWPTCEREMSGELTFRKEEEEWRLSASGRERERENVLIGERNLEKRQKGGKITTLTTQG